MAEEAKPQIEADGPTCSPGASDEQLLYAKALRAGMITGLLTLAITYVIYVTGIMAPYAPVEELSQYYSLPVNEYLEKADVKPGFLDAALDSRERNCPAPLPESAHDRYLPVCGRDEGAFPNAGRRHRERAGGERGAGLWEVGY